MEVVWVRFPINIKFNTRFESDSLCDNNKIAVFGADLSLKWGEQAFKLCKKREKELPNFKGFCGRFEV